MKKLSCAGSCDLLLNISLSGGQLVKLDKITAEVRVIYPLQLSDTVIF